ncbi:MAG: type IV pilus modification protein PilV [Granulosicoccus sp.]
MFIVQRSLSLYQPSVQLGNKFLPVYPPRQGGVGLIEILVAVVIMAIGFLAAARMQVTGMRYSQSAYFESQAYFMAGEMVARMRANVAGVQSGEYDDLTTSAELQDPGCNAKMCTPAEVAQQDIFDWSQHLHRTGEDVTFTPLLPSDSDLAARGEVNLLSGGAYSVTLVWADDNANAAGTGSLRVDFFTEN